MKELDINNTKKVWKELCEKDKNGIEDISKENSKLILTFLKEYSLGLNVGLIKGKRTSATLTKQRQHLISLSKKLDKQLDKVTQEDLHILFKKMEEGDILKRTGKKYLAVGEYVKISKSFFGWLERKKIRKDNPTIDLSVRLLNGNGRKPAWVHLTQEEIKTLINQARGDYRTLILFLYDSGLRPQEAWRLRISDFSKDYKELNIPKVRDNGEKVSKTFERTITLTQSSNLLKEYIKVNNFKDDDVLININQFTFNKYLRTLAKKLFGDKKTKARGKPSQMRAYDLRHNSCILYLDKYRKNSDLMYRFGWKKEDKVFYYSEFLGKKDTIEEDMITETDKNKYEIEIKALKKAIEEQTEEFANAFMVLEKKFGIKIINKH
jgi:integrase